MFTHCPNCNSHFEITQEYLDIASGKVRCGHCEHVFNALDNLYETQEEAKESIKQSSQPQKQIDDDINQADLDKQIDDTNTANQSPVNTIKPALDGIVLPDSGFDIKAKMEQISASLSAATLELKTARESTLIGPSTRSWKPITKDTPPVEEALTIDKSILTEGSSSTEKSTLIEKALAIEEPDPVEESSSIDESTLLEELDMMDFNDEVDEGDTYSTPATNFGTHKVDPSDLDILNSLIDAPDTHQEYRDDTLLDDLDDFNKTLPDEEDTSLDDEFSESEDSIKDNLDNGDDLLAELAQLEKDFTNDDQLSEKGSPDDAQPETSEIPGVSLDDEPSSANKEDETSVIASSLTTQATAKHAIDEVVPSFLTQQENTSSSSPTAMFGWLTGTIVLLLILAAQYLHINSVSFAQNPTLRPLLETLCPMTGCALPLVKTPEKIVTINHDVHTHPKLNNALEIQLTFKNKASYTQDYPILEIVFSNPRGEVIARRKFSPDEYLTGIIQHTQGMKTNQSQDVQLEIADPDPNSLLSFEFNYF